MATSRVLAEYSPNFPPVPDRSPFTSFSESEEESQVALTDTPSESLNSTCGHAVESAVHHTTPDHPVRLLCVVHDFPLQLDLARGVAELVYFRENVGPR
jgi:hypothetical protein